MLDENGNTITNGQWLYHPDQGAKLFWLHDVGEKLSAGWFETPDDFPSEQTEDDLLAEMTKQDLLDYALAEFDVKLDARKNKKNLMDEIMELKS